ncbi:hypothetical protein [Nonomuraea basaltis]|uniref:hypothetical protein n=1 Tax=Nonomuraea basaltis TaxID=2495887 RepID=UPI00110C4D02|nr:hypothetical protein [Nonomuraea basaltis]TMR97688.1 hypothetical protein EJK15_16725 [Nonomuraea basaltis]
MRILSVLLSALLAASPAQGTVTDFGVQSTALTVFEGYFGTGQGGRPAVFSIQMGTPGVVAEVDPVTRELRDTVQLPGSSGGWGITQTDDGTVYAGTYPNGHLYSFKPGSDEATDLGQVVPGELYAYGLQANKNGTVYGGTYPGARAFSYSPAEGFRDLGAMFEGQQYVVDIAIDPDRQLLWAAVGSAGHLIRMDLNSGDKRDIWPEALRGDPNYPYGINLVAGKLFVKRSKGQALVLDPDSGAVLADGFTMSSRGTTKVAKDGYVYFTSGTELWRYDLAANRPEQVPGPVIAGGAAVGWGFVDGTLYAAIGNYNAAAFSYDPRTGAVQRFKLPFPYQPIDINNVTAGPDGRIYTNLYINGNVAVLDPATGQVTQLGRAAQTDGWFWKDGKLYLGTYPNGAIMYYDPAKPFVSGTNPRELFRLIGDGQNRPVAFASAGSKIYIGSTPDYGLWGGALTVYDESTGEHTVLRAPVADQAVNSLTVLGDTLWGGTSVNGGGGTSPKATEAKLFTYDLATGIKRDEHTPVPGASSITSLVKGPDGLLWGLADGALFIVDPATAQVVRRVKLPAGYSGVQDELHVNPDEHVYASLDGRLFRIDPLSMKFTVARDSGVYRSSQDGSGNIWFRSGTKDAAGAVQGGARLLRYTPPPDGCPRSDLSRTVRVKDRDSGVANRYRSDGCTIEDLIEDEKYSGARLIAHVAKKSAELVASGLITPQEAARIIAVTPKP